MNKFLGKHVLVISEISGAGEPLIRMFLKEGARVSLFGREDKSLEAFRGSFRGLELAVITELNTPEDLENAFRTLDSRWGMLDVFVNNIINSYSFKKIYSENDIQTSEIISMTKNRIEFLTKKAAERMKTHGGVIINIGLERGVQSQKSQNEGRIYLNINKGLQEWSRDAARALAPKIRINTVLSGSILPDGSDPMFTAYNDLHNYKSNIAKEINKADDIASMCSFLCSMEASYISGQTFIVEAGKKHMAL